MVVVVFRRVPLQDLRQCRRLVVHGSAVVRLETVPILNEPVLDESDAEASTGAVLGSMGRVQQVGEDKAGELEEVGDECSHEEGEYRARR